jgi:penicillin-binding protein 1A
MKQRKKATQRKRGKKKRRKLFAATIKVLIIAGIIVGLASVGIFGGIMYGYATNTRPLDLSDLEVRIQTTRIYDSENNEIATLIGSESMDREQVLYKDIPQYLKDAFVAIEDERFHDHFGVDIIGLMRAVWLKLRNPSSRMQGASTITQQVVKNLTGEDDEDVKRKFKEWWRAIYLERKLDKWQILEIYMNIIYMGHSYYGVQSAAKNYFGKNVWELSLAECALLAGITNEPATYDPFNIYNKNGREAAIGRQRVILKKMLELGYIDSREYEQALKEKLVFMDKKSSRQLPVYSYFVDQVIEDVINDLVKIKGYSREYATNMLYNYGLKIYTTMSAKVQDALTEIFTDESYFYSENEIAKEHGETPQASAVVIDPWTGHVKGIYGGAGEKKANRIYNRATQAARQPGSSIKPIVVYAPAIDLRLIAPATVVDDIPVYLDDQNKDVRYPTNFENTYGGLTTIRSAIKRSVNVVAARVWKETLGPDQSLDYLKKVGIDRTDERYVSVAMGGLNKGVSTLEMAAAYVPFVNKGIYHEPITYTKVLKSDGTVLLENKAEYRTVYDEATAWIMTDMMKEVTRPGGTASSCVIGNGKDIPTAGKTGTTSDNVDKWFVGFTPYYVTAVWYGYDNNKTQIEIAYGEERTKATQIWTGIMNKIHEGLEPRDFEKPEGIVERDICIYSGKIATDLCKKDPRGSAVRTEYFIRGTEPAYSDICDVHVQAKVCTASTDKWGRFLLANPDCPPETTENRVLIRRSNPHVPRFPNEPYPLDWKFEINDGEYCTKH